MSEETEAPLAAEQPAVETPEAEAPETPVVGAEAEAPPVEEPAPKPKKSTEDILKGRIGHTTKQLATIAAENADLKAQLEAARALVGSAYTPPASDDATTDPAAPAPARSDTNPNTGRTYTQAEFDQAVAQRAAAQEFDRSAQAMYDTGAAKFDDWKDSVDTLRAVGVMTYDLLDAAMATDDGAAVIHHLGADLEEAQRIASLPPVRMGAELAKIAAQLSSPKTRAISSAPAPAPSVGGGVTAQVDLDRISQDDNMQVYAAARAKQGSKWARPRSVN